MKRMVHFLVALALVCGFWGAAQAGTLRLGHTQATTHLVHKTAENFAKLINEKTGGKVTVRVYPAETIGTNKELADACANGEIDFYISATAQYTQRYEPFSIVDAFYMFNDVDHLFKFYDSDVYQGLVDGLAEKCKVHVLAPIYYGARQMTTKSKPLNTPDDFVGLKIRAANEPLPIAAIEELGGTPTPIPYNETYLALQQGVVDGQENPPMSIQAMKFYEVQGYLNITDHQYQMLSIFLSDATIAKLDDAQVAAVREAAKEAAEAHNVEALAAEAKIVEDLGKSIEIVKSDKAAFAKKVAPMYDKFTNIWGADTVKKIKAM